MQLQFLKSKMYILSALPTALLTLLTTASSAYAASSSSSSSTVTLYAWPLEASKPQPLASIKYWPDHLNATLTSWTPPKPPSVSSSSAVDASTGLIQIGLTGGADGGGADDWTGVATSVHSLAPEHLKAITLHLDDTNNVFSVGFSASSPPDSSSFSSSDYDRKHDNSKASKQNQKQKGRSAEANVVIEVVRPAAGPEPVLNRPVVLTPDGKVPGKEEGEKTFLQKYWWAIALFVLVQVMAGGGGDSK
jgi:hypothetical protein